MKNQLKELVYLVVWLAVFCEAFMILSLLIYGRVKW